ncbi:MAG: hypothetical protein DWQ18_04555 [Crenarchaeota archaeon]|nr:MAG: hypothetical protein DWQ17_08575 [Thermoproteota archaeon]RDJ34171.1 MAG: hypothetical protein DWQ18_04555 [Thermoproteota archaeon]RDJ36714.1 MAG: hypothetical protein DWQ13_06055 [Thermoproteota archaeon]RDJ37753.1 MAG: hypothetical protein DWQ19_04780 [Thermoproteota archaeon]
MDNKEIDVKQAILLIQNIIANNQGDIGRLNFIIESLKNKKKLYKSDQNYIEKKINGVLSYKKQEQKNKNFDLQKQIKSLIQGKQGDPGRLNYILESVKKGKKLFKTDQTYLENKLKLIKNHQESVIKPKHSETNTSYQLIHNEFSQRSLKRETEIENLKQELEISKNSNDELIKKLDDALSTISTLQKTIEEKNLEITKKNQKIGTLTQELSKIKLVNNNPELQDLKNQINAENEKISYQDILHDKIKQQKERLNQLIQYRKEYEQKILKAKEDIYIQLVSENKKIIAHDRLVEELVHSQKQLEQSKVEQEIILEQIKKEQTRLLRDMSDQQKSLDESKAEFDKTVNGSKKDNISSDQ